LDRERIEASEVVHRLVDYYSRTWRCLLGPQFRDGNELWPLDHFSFRSNFGGYRVDFGFMKARGLAQRGCGEQKKQCASHA
jgi:hypothetical protein